MGGGGAGHWGGVNTPRLRSQAPGFCVSCGGLEQARFQWVERTRVELGVDGVDEPLLGSLLIGVLLDLHNDDAGNNLGCLGGSPADSDLIRWLVREENARLSITYAGAAVPEVQDLEWNGGLGTLAGLEVFQAVEGGRAELQERSASVCE